MATLPTNGFRPAPGLTFLTQAQVKEMDAKLASLRAFIEESGGSAKLVIHLNRSGHIRFVERQMTEEILPVFLNQP